MIVICTHKNPDILGRILKSIKEYSEDHRILVVETSDSQVSKEISLLYNCFFENSPLKYEIGAYNHAINLYSSESEYFMFQDSLEILQPGWEDIFRKISDNKKLVSICSYRLNEDCCHPCGKVKFESMFGLEFPVEFASAILTNSFYIPKSAMIKLKQFGIDKLIAESKVDSVDSERILGAIAYYCCGHGDLSEVLGPWNWDSSANIFTPNTGFTIYINKHIVNRI